MLAEYKFLYSPMTPNKAWTPLSPRRWDKTAARHLASRLGFSIRPDLVDRVYKEGPQATIRMAYEPRQRMQNPFGAESMFPAATTNREAVPEDRRELRRRLQRQNRESYLEFATAWYAFASLPENAPQEKLALFFENVWVVAFQCLRDASALWNYHNAVRAALASSYPEMCAGLALTAAMGHYLNLAQNRRDAPNENFARELFELFTLGEGNYTENDIKEAARALTGYRFDRQGSLTFRLRAHDDGVKTIFGQSGRFQLEDVIRILFEQPAAATFLPREFLAYYLSDEPIDDETTAALGDLWRESGYSLPYLYQTVFSSRLFYEPRYRGNLIKSPVHYYLGMHQDLELDVLPLPRAAFRLARLMGQAFMNPPNVRGWVGGRTWINSATLAARQQTAELLLTGLDTEKLNADEQEALRRAKGLGEPRYAIDPYLLIPQNDLAAAARSLANRLYAHPNEATLVAFAESIAKGERTPDLSTKKALLLSALTAPDYHLC